MRERISVRMSKDGGALDNVKFGWGNEPDDMDFYGLWDGTRMTMRMKTANSEVRWGIDGAGMDQRFFGDTVGSFMLIDQSLDLLVLSDDWELAFGDKAGNGDVSMKWNGSNFLVLPDVDLTGELQFGSASLQMDVAFRGDLSGTGVKPTDVGTTPGTAASAHLSFTGGAGGATTITTTGVGGIGGGVSYVAGAGGIAASAATASTGGAGGAVSFTAGAGGAANDAAAIGTNVGGVGGAVSMIAGVGGATLNGSSNTGGKGGDVVLQAGAGGAGGTAAGAPGAVRVNAGIFRYVNAQTIDMADVAVTLTLVPGTPVGTLVTSNVLYVDPNSGASENLLLPPEADWNGGMLVIVNTGGETINVQNNSGGAILTLETLNTAIVMNDGTTLRGVVGVP